jgi:hypothetical protein
MSTRKRDLSNENLKVTIDTQPMTKYFYYLFATTPEFFTDANNGINAYPALRQRVHDVLEVHPLTEKEMAEAGKKIKEIYCVAYPHFNRGAIPEDTIDNCAKYIDQTYSNISSKIRIFVCSFVKLLEKLKEDKLEDPMQYFQTTTGYIWDEFERRTKEAQSQLNRI